MRTTIRGGVAVFVLGLGACPGVLASQPTGLDGLIRPPTGSSARVSSNSPDPNSNADNRWVKPGETFTIADLKGPGIIRHLWFTFAEPGPSWLAKDGAADHSQIVLRMYWDGAAEPAVEAPFGDFFAAGFGRRAEIVSLPVIVQGGDSYNSFWPMPFHTSARITVTNEGDKPLAALYYQVDYTAEPKLPPDTMYFCAQYRQEFPTQLGTDYLIADIEGRGKYVGTVMSVRSRSPQWFGEGDEKFYVDGARAPTLVGTGTEDYFLNAWGMEKGCFPYYGVTQLDGWLGDLGNKGTMYRWHIADPVEFQRSLRLTIEHAGWMSEDETSTGKVEGFVEREDDFATVAFWYQQGQPRRFTTLPTMADRRLPSIDRVIEGKDLLERSTAVDAELSLQAGSPWTGAGQVFVNGTREGSSVEFTFNVPGEGKPHQPVAVLTTSYDYGIYRLIVDGRPIGPDFDGYSKLVEVQEVILGAEPLTPGEHTLRIECVGRNDASKGYKFGVDSIRLRERTGAKRPPMSGRKP
ncbi:MAG: hypothetical protein GIKADHBN_01015 [Phycisphaerales bacterium]|nr:hypothetical protein [Phycisphaerales bacterium]